jgi:hypothetical protein
MLDNIVSPLRARPFNAWNARDRDLRAHADTDHDTSNQWRSRSKSVAREPVVAHRPARVSLAQRECTVLPTMPMPRAYSTA